MQDEQGADQGAQQHRGHRDQPARDPRAGRAGQRAVRRDARDRQRQHGGGQVGHGQLARGAVLHAHGGGKHHDQRVPQARGYRRSGQRGHDHRGGEQDRLDPRGDAEQPLAAAGQLTAEAPRDQCADRETGDRDDRGQRGEPARAGQREGQEDHVAGHVGHEDVTEEQVAERVDQAGNRGQPDQQRREQTVLTTAGGRDGVPHVGQEGVHAWISAHLAGGMHACSFGIMRLENDRPARGRAGRSEVRRLQAAVLLRRARVSTVTAASRTTAVQMYWGAAPRPSSSRPL